MTGPHRWDRWDRRARRVRRGAAAAGATALVGVAGLVGLVGLSGCGVPIDREPQEISQTTVAPVETVATTVAPGGDTVSVYFLHDGRLEAAEYPIQGEVSLGQALNFVLAAPPEDGADLGTSVPPGTQLRGAEVSDDGLATIDLTGEINDVIGPTQKEAFAQIVFTALGFDEVQRVRFLVDGEPIDAPTDEGNLPVVDAEDYDPPLNPR